MSNETMRTPADVRERVKEVWATVEAAALAQAARVEEYEWNNDEAAEIRDAVAQVAALLRTPRGEGEALAVEVIRLNTALALLKTEENAAHVEAVATNAAWLEELERIAAFATRTPALRLDAAICSEAQGEGPVGAVCANCGAPSAAIAGGELDPDEAVCSVECYEQLGELGCPQEHGGTYRPKPARRGEGGGA